MNEHVSEIMLYSFVPSLFSSCIFWLLRPYCMRVANTQASSHSYQQTKKYTVCNLCRLGVEFSYY